jgi:Lipocalin-like domain
MNDGQQIEIVGRWDIISWEQVFDDGRVQRPLGEELDGFIRYTADGDMICMIMRRGRAPFTSGGQWDAENAELAEAYRSVLSYAGRYSFDGETITHHVELSLFPNWIGGDQRRRVVSHGADTIALEARLEEGTSRARTARLAWRRHKNGVEQ